MLKPPTDAFWGNVSPLKWHVTVELLTFGYICFFSPQHVCVNMYAKYRIRVVSSKMKGGILKGYFGCPYNDMGKQ